MPDEDLTPESILKDHPRMTPDDQFTFRCDRYLDCFTQCCRERAMNFVFSYT
jgi:hypothetical protein